MNYKYYYTAKDVKEILSLGHIRTAQNRIKAMNDELKEKGYWVERGKIPKKFFHEKYPFMDEKD